MFFICNILESTEKHGEIYYLYSNCAANFIYFLCYIAVVGDKREKLKMKKTLVYLFLFWQVACFSTVYANDLVLVTTTSAKSSGLLDVLIPAYEKDSGYHVKVFIVGTGRALRMGRQGKADVLLVHAPEAEYEFVNDGYGVLRTAVMKNDFIVIGPKTDPARINAMHDVRQAFTKIKNSNSQFVTRADDSGTHKKEMSIWAASNIEPYGDWYYELGAGMGDTLRSANDKQAYSLIDRGTWLAMHKNMELVLHVEGDPLLENPYSAIVVNPQRYAMVNYLAAKRFIDWLTGQQGRQIINDLKVDGVQLFTTPENK